MPIQIFRQTIHYQTLIHSPDCYFTAIFALNWADNWIKYSDWAGLSLLYFGVMFRGGIEEFYDIRIIRGERLEGEGVDALTTTR